jgi:preprotein translocase subunit SecY
MIVLVAGTMFTMWLGEKITDKGIGNGISMLIMIGIIARLPSELVFEMGAKGMSGALLFIIEIVALYFVVMGVVMLTQATRRVPVQYAKQVVGKKVYGGQRQYIPLKVNSSGVMPIIFAQALMFLPAMLAGIWADSSDIANYIGNTFSNILSWQYNLVFGIMIILFTFFYTAITVNPNQIADDMKRNGGFIPGIKPGKQTSEFIDNILSKITLPGSIFLALVAVLPTFATLAGVSQGFAQFYGGTSLLIMVGVILDTLQQIESYLLMRHYEGMMKSGKIKGRSQNAAVA